MILDSTQQRDNLLQILDQTRVSGAESKIALGQLMLAVERAEIAPPPPPFRDNEPEATPAT